MRASEQGPGGIAFDSNPPSDAPDSMPDETSAAQQGKPVASGTQLRRTARAAADAPQQRQTLEPACPTLEPTCHQGAGHVAAAGRPLRPALDAAVREEAAALQRVQRRKDDRKDLQQTESTGGPEHRITMSGTR